MLKNVSIQGKGVKYYLMNTLNLELIFDQLYLFIIHGISYCSLIINYNYRLLL